MTPLLNHLRHHDCQTSFFCCHQPNVWPNEVNENPKENLFSTVGTIFFFFSWTKKSRQRENRTIYSRLIFCPDVKRTFLSFPVKQPKWKEILATLFTQLKKFRENSGGGLEAHGLMRFSSIRNWSSRWIQLHLLSLLQHRAFKFEPKWAQAYEKYPGMSLRFSITKLLSPSSRLLRAFQKIIYVSLRLFYYRA